MVRVTKQYKIKIGRYLLKWRSAEYTSVYDVQNFRLSYSRNELMITGISSAIKLHKNTNYTIRIKCPYSNKTYYFIGNLKSKYKDNLCFNILKYKEYYGKTKRK